MKKSHYVFGTVNLMLILLGMMFKINHLPGANILLILSLGLFGIVFIPLAFTRVSRNQESTMVKRFYLVAMIISMFNIVGMIWVIMHWPGASIVVITGILSIPVILIPVLFFSFNDELRTNTKTLIYILFFVIYIAVMDVFLSIGPRKVIPEKQQTDYMEQKH